MKKIALALGFVLCGLSSARAQVCTLQGMSDAVSGLDPYQPCVESALTSQPFAAVIEKPKANTAELLQSLASLAASLRAETSLPADVVRQWLERLEVPSSGKSLDPGPFVQSVNTQEKTCGCAWVIGTKGDGPYVCIDAGAPARGCVDVYTDRVDAAHASRLFSYAYLASTLLTRLTADDRAAIRKRLHRARGKWDRFLARGYTQFPWELLPNAAIAERRRKAACKGKLGPACEKAELEPLPGQMVLLHPSAGLGFRGIGLNGWDPSPKAVVVLNIEALGAVWYTSNFDQYYGFSASLAIPDVDFGDPQLGLTLHVTRWIHAGYVVSLIEGSKRGDATLFVAADLFGVLSKYFSSRQ